jgi:aldose 1-epimerase
MDGSSIHGLLYNKHFKVADQYANDHMATLRLRYLFNKEDEGYPFEYACEVIYTLLPDRKLRIETTIENLDDQAIPVADGWHPYFKLGGVINDYELQFTSETMLEFDESLIPTGKYVYEPSFRKPTLIGDRFIDNCFILQKSGEEPVCVLRNPANRLSISFFTDSFYPFLQIYTPDHRRSIAIENLSGAPNCFNNGMGLIKLNPRESQSFQVTYQAGIR